MAIHSYDAVIIGTGLSGLIASRRTAEAGRHVLVLEKEKAVGGRQRTTEVDGFPLDHGFQLLNPAYSQIKKYVDIDALDFHPFRSGVSVRIDQVRDLLAHTARHPQHLKSTLSSDLTTKTETAAFIKWFGKRTVSLVVPIQIADLSGKEAWDRAGITRPLRERVLEPFLAGVVATNSLSISSDYVNFLFRMFAPRASGCPFPQHPSPT